MKKTCLVCSKEFITYLNWIKRGGGKYCSHKCQGLAKRNKIVRICDVCGKQFEVKPSAIRHSGAKYCSHRCMWKGQKGQKKPSIQGNKAPKWKDGRTLIQKFCIDCGKKLGDHRSTRCQKCAYKMELHHNWQNGLSFLPYTSQFNDELKEKIRRRDNYICQLCGVINEEHILIYGYDLVIHHIDYIKENCEENNLLALCNQCNLRVNFNRAYWTDFFKKKLKILLSQMEERL